MSTNKSLLVIGAGGLGREVVSHFVKNDSDLHWEFIGFVDDRMQNRTIEGWPIIGVIEDIYEMSPSPTVAIAIADPRTRKRLFLDMKRNNISIATLIHPSATISPDVEIEEGSIVCTGSIIMTNVRLGKACIVNPGSFIGHDTILHDWVSLMPRVSVAGEVIVGEGSYLGINSSIINRTEVGEWCVIGAGAIVTKEIPPHSMAVGVPARIIKTI